MKQKHRLLVIVDPRQGFDQPAIERALLFAKATDADTHLFTSANENKHHLSVLAVKSGEKSARDKQAEDCKGLLSGMCQQFERQSLKCRWSVDEDAPLNEAVLGMVRQLEPTIVLKESHFHRKIVRAVFHRTDWELIAQCPTPLWLAKSGAWSNKENVIACIDPIQIHDKEGSIDKEIMRQSFELASCLGGRVEVFHSLAPLADYAKPFVIDSIVDKVRNDYEKQLLEFLQPFKITQDHLHLQEGYPETVLNNLITPLNAGLVVIGGLARHGLNSMLLGSTAQRVLDKVACDMVVIKGPKTESEK